MVAPLLILAFMALTAGGLGSWVDSFLSPSLGGHGTHHEDALLETIAVFAGLGGILVAGLVYMVSSDRMEFAKNALAPLYDILFHKYYVDEIYDFLIVKPVKAISAFLEDRGERNGIDFAVDEAAAQVREASRYISWWQNGKVGMYALNMVGGMVVALLFVVFL